MTPSSGPFMRREAFRALCICRSRAEGDRSAYFYDGDHEANHDVVIVGWDDSYPREAFSPQPEGDGAFLCANSWGEDFGDLGFFYVSYEDTQIGRHNVSYAGVENTENYSRIFQTDLCGWTRSAGLWEGRGMVRQRV